MSEDIKRVVKEAFSKSKESYVQSSTHKSQSDLDLITEWLEPENKWQALDIATGGGHVAKTLSRSVGTVFATDLTKDMLQNTARHLKEQHNIYYIVADAEELPFLDESFDVITCRIAPHHFPSPSKFIEETHRVLKPDGRFLMIDNVAPEDEQLDNFYNTFEKKRDPSHVRALKISEWQNYLEKHNLTINKQLSRKKRLPFREWVTRILSATEEHQAVEILMRQAPNTFKTYFSITEKEDCIESFSIDEWMVLAQKDS
ncbi:class I SAM-dependent methyltransferase [Halobacillus litoralis]|uniref:SAM-dependent methyltransferase n=1 Tax=Halobacillus litoralis TaxID=45668 RepID=A0A410MCW5_9BACI|nr:class I SAM-dependent methyltransferase [Halobacillus litoralis]QAS52561.1 SAM-dependent methyltransferase [Halobacillus litoralis]